MTHEFVPPDYFRRLQAAEIYPDATRPLELDVGSGDGTFITKMAAHFPERDFLGIERLNGRVATTCKKAQRLGLKNLQVLRLESAYALEWLLPLRSVSRMHLLFADPWPKKKHAKNRFLQGQSIVAMHSLLRPDGEFCFKTDDAPYFIEGCENLLASGLFEEMPWDSAAYYPITDFESQWLEAGRSIHAARWQPVTMSVP